MTTGEATLKCPQCFGGNVEPRGDSWFCHDCDLLFDIVVGQDPPPAKPGPKRPKRPAK